MTQNINLDELKKKLDEFSRIYYDLLEPSPWFNESKFLVNTITFDEDMNISMKKYPLGRSLKQMQQNIKRLEDVLDKDKDKQKQKKDTKEKKDIFSVIRDSFWSYFDYISKIVTFLVYAKKLFDFLDDVQELLPSIASQNSKPSEWELKTKKLAATLYLKLADSLDDPKEFDKLKKKVLEFFDIVGVQYDKSILGEDASDSKSFSIEQRTDESFDSTSDIKQALNDIEDYLKGGKFFETLSHQVAEMQSKNADSITVTDIPHKYVIMFLAMSNYSNLLYSPINKKIYRKISN